MAQDSGPAAAHRGGNADRRHAARPAGAPGSRSTATKDRDPPSDGGWRRCRCTRSPHSMAEPDSGHASRSKRRASRCAARPDRAGAGTSGPARRRRPTAARAVRQPPASRRHPHHQPLRRTRPPTSSAPPGCTRSVEDHADDRATDGQQQALAVLAAQFRNRVAELVVPVTSPPNEPGRDRHQESPRACRRQPRRHPWALLSRPPTLLTTALT